MNRRVVAVLVAVLAGPACRGEFDGEGGGDGENLLVNGSFEDWAGADPLAWTLAASGWEPVEDEPSDGSRAIRVSSAGYENIEQVVTLEGTLPQGTQLGGEAVTRWIDGDTTNATMVIQLEYVDGDDEDYPVGQFATFRSGEWVSGSVAVEAEREVVGFRFSLELGQGGTAQTAEFDAAAVRVVP